MSDPTTDPAAASPSEVTGAPWLTPGVRGIGLASLLSDIGHEVPTALLPSFLTTTLGAPVVVLGLIEGIADAISGITKVIGGALADDPNRRRSVAVGGYTLTAILSALIGLATSVWMVGVLRAGSWAARGIRGPSRNALLADAVHPSAFGRAYGFERAMDNRGAVIGPILALTLVALIGIREAILLSVIPGLLAALAIAGRLRGVGGHRSGLGVTRSGHRLRRRRPCDARLVGIARVATRSGARDHARLSGDGRSIPSLGLHPAHPLSRPWLSTPGGRKGAHRTSGSTSAAGSQKPNSDPPCSRRAHTRPPMPCISSRHTNSPMPAPAAWCTASGAR
ncbi:MAG: MFS transporter [Chloroflexi bacterium]|nr:MFS transporter [Chloroflexota bacterium]